MAGHNSRRELYLEFGSIFRPNTHDQEIAEQVDLDVLEGPAHVILLETTNSLADGSFDLFLRSRGNRS